MKPSEILKKHAKDIIDISGQFGFSKVRVFGSVLHAADTEKSDLDLLVNTSKKTTLLDLIGLQQTLEDRFGISVDVLTEKDLPARFRQQVLREARFL